MGRTSALQANPYEHIGSCIRRGTKRLRNPDQLRRFAKVISTINCAALYAPAFMNGIAIEAFTLSGVGQRSLSRSQSVTGSEYLVHLGLISGSAAYAEIQSASTI